MTPRFPPGTIGIFEKCEKFNDGDFLLIDFHSYPAPIFRQILIFNSIYYLNAHNPKFDRLILDSKSKVLGRLVQAILTF